MTKRQMVFTAFAAVAVLGASVGSDTDAQAVAQEPPVGEFRVVPPSGPIGATVLVSGDFDREITGVRFQCWHYDTPDLVVDAAYTAEEPSPSFTFAYTIPAEMGIRQPRTNVVTRTPLGGDCEFLAEAGHRILTASVPFTVTAPAIDPPSTGLTSRPPGTPVAPAAVVILAVGGAVLVLLGWRFSQPSRR